jgi:hypothetical protein
MGVIGLGHIDYIARIGFPAERTKRSFHMGTEDEHLEKVRDFCLHL